MKKEIYVYMIDYRNSTLLTFKNRISPMIEKKRYFSTEHSESSLPVNSSQSPETPFPLSKLNHGRIVSKLLKAYDISFVY